MVKTKRAPSYILPHNPLGVTIIEELKRLKGEKAWLQWELELLTAQYPDNTILKAALEQYTTKAVAATSPPATTLTEQADKVTPATDATTAKVSTKGNGNKTNIKAKATNKKEAK